MAELALFREPERPSSLSGDFLGSPQFDIQSNRWDGLWFPLDALFLWTEFRANVLNFIYRTALVLCGGSLVSAEVSVTSTPDEVDSLALDLVLTLDTGWEEIQSVERQIFDRIAVWSSGWSDWELDDYAKSIYFGLIPSRL